MKIDITKRPNPNYGKYRTVKVFALFPRVLHYGEKTYFVWFEYFYQDQHFYYNAYLNHDGWFIKSDYPMLPEVKPTY